MKYAQSGLIPADFAKPWANLYQIFHWIGDRNTAIYGPFPGGVAPHNPQPDPPLKMRATRSRSPRPTIGCLMDQSRLNGMERIRIGRS